MERDFVGIELEHMPKVAPGASPVFYGLRFEVEGKRYDVRATSLLGGTFGLFDCSSSSPTCTQVTTLKGGYGTPGIGPCSRSRSAKSGWRTGGGSRTWSPGRGSGAT